MEGPRGLGRAIFAAVFLMISGVLNVIYGIAGISNAHVFQAHSSNQYVFGNLKTWGWITLILGILELLASLSLFGGATFGRWFAIFAASLVAIDSLLDYPGIPPSCLSRSSRSACGSSTGSSCSARTPRARSNVSVPVRSSRGRLTRSWLDQTPSRPRGGSCPSARARE